MSKTPLVIFGMSSYAQIVALYFSRLDEYEPIALCVDDEYANLTESYGLPIIPASKLLETISPKNVAFHVAVTYTNMNRLRREKIDLLKSWGFTPASYVSPRAYVDETAVLGEHIFIFEDNTIQPFTKVSDGAILWSGNHIGHHTTIQNDVFVSSHVVISGHCDIGARSFLGVNATLGNNISLGEENWLLPGTNLIAGTDKDEMWRPEKSVRTSKRPSEAFNLS